MDKAVEGTAAASSPTDEEALLSGSIQLNFKSAHPPDKEGGSKAKKAGTFCFATRSLLEMCWGMTLNFSQYNEQQVLGAIFNEHFKKIFEGCEKDEVNGDFLRNLSMTMSGSLRNLGYIRSTHIAYLNFNNERLSRKGQNLEKASEFTSFSGTGLFAKLAAFVGTGSIATLTPVLDWSKSYVVWSEDNILLFVASGVLGALIITSAVKAYLLYRELRDENYITKIKIEQKKYWIEHYKGDATDELYQLLQTIRRLIERYYPNHLEIFSQDELLKYPNNENKVKEIISREILPPDNLEWFPLAMSASTGSQSTDTQSKEKTSKS